MHQDKKKKGRESITIDIDIALLTPPQPLLDTLFFTVDRIERSHHEQRFVSRAHTQQEWKWL